MMKCTICGNEDFMDFGHTELCLCCGKQNKLTDTALNPHLVNAYLFLFEGEFVKADQVFDELLADDPEEAYAYFGKLLVKLHLKSTGELSCYTRNFKEESYFLRAYAAADNRGDKQLKERLLQYHSDMEQHAAKIRFDRAKTLMDNAVSEQHWNDAVYWFEMVLKYDPNYPNAVTLLEQCRTVVSRLDLVKQRYTLACEQMKRADVSAMQQALQLFEEIHSYLPVYEDSIHLESICRKEVEAWQSRCQKYEQAVALMQPDASIEDLQQAVALLEQLAGQENQPADLHLRIRDGISRIRLLQKQQQLEIRYRLAVELIEEEQSGIEDLNQAFSLLSSLAAEAPDFVGVEDQVKRCCQRRNLLQKQQQLEIRYRLAVELIEEEQSGIEDLNQAFSLLSSLAAEAPDFVGVEDQVKRCCQRRNLLQKQQREQLLRQKLEQGKALMPSGATLPQYEQAIRYFTDLIAEYGHTRETETSLRIAVSRRNILLLKTHGISQNERYQWALSLMKAEASYLDWCDALDLLLSLMADGGYPDATLRTKECTDRIGNLVESYLCMTEPKPQSSIPMMLEQKNKPIGLAVNPAMRMMDTVSPITSQPKPIEPSKEQISEKKTFGFGSWFGKKK